MFYSSTHSPFGYDLSLVEWFASARQQGAYQNRARAGKYLSYEIGILGFAQRDCYEGYVTTYRQVSKYRRYRGEEFTILTFQGEVLHPAPRGDRPIKKPIVAQIP
jgi:hypothetical protein